MLPSTDDCHHVALLRKPMLTVNYRPGPQSPVPGLGYAAVFLADPSLDGAFADSEPAAHDSWSWSDMKSRHEKTFVKMALKRIDEALRNQFQSTMQDGGTQEQANLGGFMQFMAGLVPDSPGTGGAIPPGPAAKGAQGKPLGGPSRGLGQSDRRANGTGRRPNFPWIDEGVTTSIALHAGKRVCKVGFKLQDIADGTIVAATGHVLVDNGDHSETDKESSGQEVPVVIGWRPFGNEDPEALQVCKSLRLNAGQPGEWEVLLTLPDDALIDVELHASMNPEGADA